MSKSVGRVDDCPSGGGGGYRVGRTMYWYQGIKWNNNKSADTVKSENTVACRGEERGVSSYKRVVMRENNKTTPSTVKGRRGR